VNDPLKPALSTTPADRVAIIAEKRPNHNGQRFVLFYDGSVRAFDETQFDKLEKNSFVDVETNDTKR
jgi:prepilin-type processing-associated H-X9-DG protein